MKKAIVIILFILGICIGVYSIQTGVINVLFSENTQTENTSGSGEIVALKEPQKEKTQEEITKDQVREKIEKIKKRLALKGLISEGDEYFRNDQLTAALKSYIQAYKKNKEDEKIIKKLGDTYFEMHRFEMAQKYYKQLLDYTGFDTNTLALALIYSDDISDINNISPLIAKLQDINLSEDEYFYYENSLLCLSDFHKCKIAFDEYKKTSETEGEPKEITSTNLKEIKKAIENYRNFQVDQVYFKNALIVGAFYTNKNYPLAIELGKNLLAEKSDYKPIIKIIADSYYKLGDYENAKIYLSSYYKKDTSDGAIAYLLGVIHSEEGDYVLSNIYLNKALKNGYTPAINIHRKLVHNYFLLESAENIVRSLHDLIQPENQYDKNDLELAIYYYILYEEYDQAKTWIQIGMEKHPTEENFHGYLGWIQYELGNTEVAKEEIQKGLDINKDNSFLNYNMGRIEKETGNTGLALIYFKKVVKISPESDFGISAKKEIESILKSKK